jgi:catechol 2,3-dioxygenase-like lactoylglutathione lyase family enzyme
MPPKLNAICPIYQVENLERAIEFYTRVLGFEVAWKAGDPHDRASLCRDAVEITLETREPNEPKRLSRAYLYVTGIDAYVADAQAKGAPVTVPLADRWYGMRDCRVRDLDGNELHIGEALAQGQ